MKLIKLPTTSEERIQSNINRFRRELLASDMNAFHVQELLQVCCEYLSEYDDHELGQAYIKLEEGCFYIEKWLDT